MVVSCLDRGQIQVRRFQLFRKLLADRLFYFGHVDLQQPGHDTHIDHVLNQFAQLGLRADRSDKLVVRNGIENQIRSKAAKLQGLVVQNRRTRR